MDSVLASGNQVVHLQVAFPPTEEALNTPTELVNLGDVFGCQIVPVCGDPVILALNTVANKAQLCLCLILAFCTKKDDTALK